MYTLQGEFIKQYPSMLHASKDLGIYQSGINHCCNGDYSHYKHYIFRLTSDKRPVLPVGKRIKSVAQLDKDGNIIKMYSSPKEAALSVGALPTSVSACCLGKQRHTKGLFFKYAS